MLNWISILQIFISFHDTKWFSDFYKCMSYRSTILVYRTKKIVCMLTKRLFLPSSTSPTCLSLDLIAYQFTWFCLNYYHHRRRSCLSCTHYVYLIGDQKKKLLRSMIICKYTSHLNGIETVVVVVHIHCWCQ